MTIMKKKGLHHIASACVLISTISFAGVVAANESVDTQTVGNATADEKVIGSSWLPPLAKTQRVADLPPSIRADIEDVPACRVSVERLPPIPGEPDPALPLEKLQAAVAYRQQVLDLWKPLFARCHKMAVLERELRVAVPESLRAVVAAKNPAVAELFVPPDRVKLGDEAFVVMSVAKAAKLRELAKLRAQSRQLAGEVPGGGARVAAGQELLPPIGGATENVLTRALGGGLKR